MNGHRTDLRIAGGLRCYLDCYLEYGGNGAATGAGIKRSCVCRRL